ncbi:MAG: YqeG family HAD IIIA-type phosphatase [Lachnospiraceae bacterium]|nr:YqeG family HAD IIIA-type phosphatase [Lachnospiraceae bacterium]
MAKLFPDAWEECTFTIDYEKLYKLGYRGLIFDIDNTLVFDCAPADERAITFLNKVRDMGFKVCLLSNNKEKRVKMFNKDIGADYIFHARKPRAEGYIKAMEKMHTTRENTIFIGDQVYTDVWGAKNANVKVIMVKKLGPKEEKQIVLKRIIEKPVMALFFLLGGKRKKFY